MFTIQVSNLELVAEIKFTASRIFMKLKFSVFFTIISVTEKTGKLQTIKIQSKNL